MAIPIATLAFDVDGVLADLQTAWLARYNKEYNDNLTPEKCLTWETHKYTKPECGKKYYKYLDDPSIYDEVLPTSPNALECVKKLRKADFRVIFVTTSVISAAGAKFYWLKKWGFNKEMKDYVEATDKNLINADALVDDKADNTNKWWSQGNKLSILFTRTHNAWEKVPYYHTNNWDEIYTILSGGVE